jgi:hypothetical protein
LVPILPSARSDALKEIDEREACDSSEHKAAANSQRIEASSRFRGIHRGIVGNFKAKSHHCARGGEQRQRRTSRAASSRGRSLLRNIDGAYPGAKHERPD